MHFIEQAQRARVAARALATAARGEKDAALRAMAQHLLAAQDAVLAANAEDVARAQAAALSAWGAFPGYRSP